MGITAVLIIVSSVIIAVQSKYYAIYNDRLGRDFMHFGKRSSNKIPRFDQNALSLKRGEFSRDFMNFGKRSIGDGWPDEILKIGDTPELLYKKRNFDREFMNFGKPMTTLDRTLINPNKKSGVDANAFNRDFLSFGKR